MFSALFGIIAAKMLLLSLHLESRTLPKPLTEKEEKEEFRKYHDGDKAARDKLIKHNLRLVAHVAKKYSSNARDTEDLISIGTIGLIKAVQTFDESKSVRFSTYAAKCVDNAMLSQGLSEQVHKKRAMFRYCPLFSFFRLLCAQCSAFAQADSSIF